MRTLKSATLAGKDQDSPSWSFSAYALSPLLRSSPPVRMPRPFRPATFSAATRSALSWSFTATPHPRIWRWYLRHSNRAGIRVWPLRFPAPKRSENAQFQALAATTLPSSRWPQRRPEEGSFLSSAARFEWTMPTRQRHPGFSTWWLVSLTSTAWTAPGVRDFSFPQASWSSIVRESFTTIWPEVPGRSSMFSIRCRLRLNLTLPSPPRALHPAAPR